MRRLMSGCVRVLVAAVVLSVAVLAQTTGEFTIVALPDTQIYAKEYPQIFAAQTKWIADHKTEMNIQTVIGLGDIVDAGGRISQWQTADAAYRLLDGVVPYFAAIGNHDYDANNPAGRTAYTKNFNNYFGPARYRGKSWYSGSYPAGSNENFYGTVTLGGTQYLILVLECFPRDAALNWAAGILKANADKPVIVVTHAYTYYDNMRMSKCDSNSSYSFAVGADNDGEDIWTKLLSKYANVVMVLSGHVVQGDGTGRRADIGANGNLVNQILADYQSWPVGGSGYLRLITVKPAMNQVSVRTYSPYLDKWLTDSHNEFVVPYRAAGVLAATATQGTVTGKVKSAINCSALSGVSVSIGPATVTTDSAGKFSIGATSLVANQTTAKRSGWGSSTKLTSVIPGTQGPAKFLMATSGVLRGSVVTSGGAKLAGAKITVTGGALKQSKTFSSDAYGKFYSGWIAVGSYKVSVSMLEYGSYTGTATITTGNTTTATVTLK
jgi:hypothetical protein